MRTKILLAGSQTTILDDFFSQISDAFICISTSNRFNDLRNHIIVFEPDVLVYCVSKDSIGDSENILTIKSLLKDKDTAIVIIGDKPDIDDLNPVVIKYAQLVLYRPISIKKAQDSIDELMAEREEKRKAEANENAQGEPEAKAEKKHILVVDDDPTMLRTVKEFLEDTYSVATAPSGKFALKFLSHKPTDLILLDYEMPELNGPEVFAAIKDDENTAKIPVVFLTGITDSSKIKSVLAMQPNGYLLKPVDRDRLYQTIEGILNEMIM